MPSDSDSNSEEKLPYKTKNSKKMSTRLSKGLVITGLYENVQLRHMLKEFPEAESLRRASREELSEALRNGVFLKMRFLGQRDILTLVRTFRTRKELREEQRLKRMRLAEELEQKKMESEVEKSSTEMHYLLEECS